MREIDTEAPVEWPAWCYSANTQESAIDVISRKGDLASDLLPATSPSSYIQSSNTTILPISVSLNKSRTRRKNHHTTSSSSASTPATAGRTGGSASYDNSIVSNTSTITSVPSISPSSHDISSVSEKLQQHLQLSSFLINKKMLSERILMGFGTSASDNISNNSANINNNNNNNNNSSNGKKNCDSSTISVYDKIKHEAQIMDPITTVHLGSSSLKNGDLSATNNGSSGGGGNAATNHMSSNVKKERLSPLANGDVQSSMSRSRSATPSSFPGTPPQSIAATHVNDLTTQNLLSQSRNNEFQSRNYSDFMRSLAAKYNNTNPNDSATARNLFFDHQKHTSNSGSTTKSTNKSQPPSPPEIKRPSLPTPPLVPFVSPLFPGLPFPSTVFPSLIDMSSTQALVTLARAAKEAELQNILRNAQKRPNTASTTQSLSPSLRSVLTPTPQQLAQFNPQSFMLPTQFQTPPHRSPSARSPRNSQSPHQYRGEPSASTSTTATPTASNSITIKRSSSPPLDLSSTQYSKRRKSTSNTSSPAANPPMSSTTTTTTSNVIKSETSLNDSPQFLESCSSTVKQTESLCAVGPSSRLEFPKHCRAESDEISSWSVDDVYRFVTGIDICAEYAQKFRDQCIDGSGLPLLTEDHFTNSLGMKLGPALKLRSILAKKLGGPCPCVSCTTLQQQLILQQQQQQQQPPPPAIHLTPPRVGGSSSATISSSSSTLSSTSTISGSSLSSACAEVASTPMTIKADYSNNNNTANNSSVASSLATATNSASAASNSQPTWPASADSGS